MNIRMLEKRKGLRSGRSRYGGKGVATLLLSEGDVELYVDVERLMEKLAGAALCNKNGKAVLADGAVTALAVNRQSQVLEVPYEESHPHLRKWITGAA